MNPRDYYVFSDGSSDKEGFGGYAYIITDSMNKDAKVINLHHQGIKDTTNNRMELQGVIDSLHYCLNGGMKRDQVMYGVHLHIVSDSAYVINCFVQKWYLKWLRNGWQGSTGPVLNKDLWLQLFRLVDKLLEQKFQISWQHVRGHRECHWNNFCDKLAGEARRDIKTGG